MTANHTLTGPAWQAPIDVPAGVRVLVTTGNTRGVEYAAVEAGAAAPAPDFRGHPIAGDNAREARGETVEFGGARRLWLRAATQGAGESRVVVVTHLD